MNIGIDFDNTITEDHEFFSKLTNALVKGNEVYIISSCDKEMEPRLEEEVKMKKEKLNGWGIAYKELMLALEPIPENKAEICRRYEIDAMIDDDARNIKAIRKGAEGVVCLQYIV